MGRLSTCKMCELQIPTSEKRVHNSKTYCEICYEKVIRESNEYKNLIQYICDNFDIEVPTGLILKQIKELKGEFHYTYGGMTYTLWYVKEILGKELSTTYGVSIIKYYYDEAGRYYLHQESIKESIKKIDKNDFKTKVIKINNKPSINTNSDILINLSDLI